MQASQNKTNPSMLHGAAVFVFTNNTTTTNNNNDDKDDDDKDDDDDEGDALFGEVFIAVVFVVCLSSLVCDKPNGYFSSVFRRLQHICRTLIIMRKRRESDHYSEICFERILKFMTRPMSRRLKHEKNNGSKH